MNKSFSVAIFAGRTKIFWIVLVLLLVDLAPSMAQVCGYYYRKPITINGSRITGGPHVNFPVLISHTDPALTAASAKVTNANGYDIVFTDNSGNALNFQLEKYNASTGQIVAWVKIPSITSGTSVTIQMLYGNAAITTNQSTTNTWSSGYHGVWHFNGNVNDGSATGVTSVNNATTNTTGKIGDARNFVDPTSWVELTNFSNMTAGFTISAWIYPTDVTRDGQRIFVDDVNNTGGYGFSLADEGVAGRLRFYSRGSNPVSLDAPSFILTNNNWYHVAAVADIAGNIKRIYVNGVERVSQGYANAWGTDVGNASIGGETAAGETGNRFHGNMDEVRVANRALSAQWLATEYNSQNQPTTTVGVVTPNDFYTVGSEVVYGNPAQFGSNTWNVYAYNGNNFESYYGYYVHNTLNFDSRTVWAAGGTPSSAAGYVGCTIPNDNHSYRYKRRGFPCGYYQLDIPNHDDNVVLYVNGANVFQQDSWYAGVAKTNQWRGYLDANSEIEYTIREFGGDSHAGLTFVYLYGPQNSATQSVWNGNTSTDWSTSSNWCSSEPTSTIGAYIPSGVVRYPLITANESVLDLTITSGATLTINDGGSLASYGNWTNNGTFTPNNSSSVVFAGSNANQFGGSSTTTFANVEINNSNASALTLTSNLYVNGEFNFTDGEIITGTNMVVFNAGSSVGSVSNASYVSGMVRKIGNTAFVFPVGKNGNYARIRISAPSNAAFYFTAEYFNADPHLAGYTATSLGAGLDHVSRCEYWILDRGPGASNENVTLSWATPRSCGVTDLADMRVAGWNGSQWVDWGTNGTPGGNPTTGTVRSNGAVSAFGVFTLASSTPDNPLPIELLTFSGTYKGNYILLQWKTATELNNDFFTLEKSRDGNTWREIGKVPGGGTTQLGASYSHQDPQPWNGVQYYRLSQTDFDGSVTSFPLITVDVEQLQERTTVTIHPNPTEDEVNIDISTPLKGPFNIQLVNPYGNVLHSSNTYEYNETLSLRNLAAGVYIMIIATEREIYRSKILRK